MAGHESESIPNQDLETVRAKVRIGSVVTEPHGDEPVGTVEKVIVCPRTREVTHLLLRKAGRLQHDVVIPLSAVDEVGVGRVHLGLPVEQLNQAASPDAADYVAPPHEWEGRQGYEPGSTLFALPRPLQWLEHLLPRRSGRTPAVPAGVEGVLLGSDTKVETTAGPLGTVDRVLIDPDTGRLTHIVVRRGRLLSKHLVVPLDWAEEISDEVVRLAANPEQLLSLPEYKPDDELAEAVIANLSTYPKLRRVLRGTRSYQAPVSGFPREGTLEVMVQDGIAILEGNVESGGYSSMAEWLARQVPGVRGVRNLLVVDSDLQVAVAQALARDSRTRQVQPRVSVDFGEVTLTGQAPDEQSLLATTEVAGRVPGVRRVNNRLSVPPG